MVDGPPIAGRDGDARRSAGRSRRFDKQEILYDYFLETAQEILADLEAQKNAVTDLTGPGASATRRHRALVTALLILIATLQGVILFVLLVR